MRRALFILAPLLLASPAWAQGRPNITVHRMFGIDVAGAAPIGDFKQSAQFGFQFVLRGGPEIIIGRGAYIAPDVEINFVRFGATGAAELAGLDSAIGVGFMIGSRFGYEFQGIATPYFDLHLGYYHGQAFGNLCDVPAVDCGREDFGMEFGFGSIFWLSP